MATTQELIDGLQTGAWKICDQDALTVRLEKVKPKTRGEQIFTPFITRSIEVAGIDGNNAMAFSDTAMREKWLPILIGIIDAERAAAVKEFAAKIESEYRAKYVTHGYMQWNHCAVRQVVADIAASMNITLD